ncbi:hypothetical protein PTSG_12564 [Salpingoeca rosetta]|uniref:Uncharacterized protein n=1 Tax=Salpingoeca rosetta (strain ATCC 50818 / BSB-021) TaxID=946362 RepID=F2UEI9_SALR5|nr:uncharacterized protein PTSG_12564 [Salpingoeca rosetta]EGD75039.1 hypothetical protein PTSG_12564 [Salpingoeca rosetta]|eukprot:XP_004992683.1 hypothetical protein PTSG_12564 [Salpingoeca rosetta]
MAFLSTASPAGPHPATNGADAQSTTLGIKGDPRVSGRVAWLLTTRISDGVPTSHNDQPQRPATTTSHNARCSLPPPVSPHPEHTPQPTLLTRSDRLWACSP